MQGFITASPWEAQEVFAELQAVFAEELVPTTFPGPRPGRSVARSWGRIATAKCNRCGRLPRPCRPSPGAR
jgi:hypothetical protein